jgi:hypothetical protein
MPRSTKNFLAHCWHLVWPAAKQSWGLHKKLGTAATIFVSLLLALGANPAIVGKTATGIKALPLWAPFLPIALYLIFLGLWVPYCRISDLEDQLADKYARAEIEKMFYTLSAMGKALLLELRVAPVKKVPEMWYEEGSRWLATVRQELFAKVSPIDAAAFDEASEGSEKNVEFESDHDCYIKEIHIAQLLAHQRKLSEIAERVRTHYAATPLISQTSKPAR